MKPNINNATRRPQCSFSLTQGYIYTTPHPHPPSCPPPPYTTTHSAGRPSLFTFTPAVHLPPILPPTQLDTPLCSHSHLLSTSPLYYHPLSWTLHPSYFPTLLSTSSLYNHPLSWTPPALSYFSTVLSTSSLYNHLLSWTPCRATSLQPTRGAGMPPTASNGHGARKRAQIQNHHGTCC